jgi:hypothetical protein
LHIAAATLAEAGLSFLGLGVQPPTPSWGAMLNVGRGYLEVAPWMAMAPGHRSSSPSWGSIFWATACAMRSILASSSHNKPRQTPCLPRPVWPSLAHTPASAPCRADPCMLLRLGHQLVLVLIPQRRSTGTLDDFFHTIPPRSRFTSLLHAFIIQPDSKLNINLQSWGILEKSLEKSWCLLSCAFI